MFPGLDLASRLDHGPASGVSAPPWTLRAAWISWPLSAYPLPLEKLVTSISALRRARLSTQRIERSSSITHTFGSLLIVRLQWQIDVEERPTGSALALDQPPVLGDLLLRDRQAEPCATGPS